MTPVLRPNLSSEVWRALSLALLLSGGWGVSVGLRGRLWVPGAGVAAISCFT
jgi:hypothetical protein